MIAFLKKIHLFESLTPPEMDRIETICRIKAVGKGEVLFKEGEPGEACYLISSGEIRISKFIPHVGEEALAVLKPGDYFGEMALIDSSPRSAHAIANADSALIEISKSDFHRVIGEDHELGYKLLWELTKTLSRRLRETNEKMACFLAMSGSF